MYQEVTNVQSLENLDSCMGPLSSRRGGGMKERNKEFFKRFYKICQTNVVVHSKVHEGYIAFQKIFKYILLMHQHGSEIPAGTE